MPNPMPATRRRWQATLIITLFFVAVAAAAGIGWWYARESPPHQGPIVLISIEALQARGLHAYGASTGHTPAIDALAADSVIFTRAYAHSPQTLPASVSILTGQLPFEHGVRDNAGFVLPAQARTLAEQLRNRGFTTGGAVSSFLLRKETGTAQGFQFFDGEMPAPPSPQAPPVVERDGLRTYAMAERWMRMQNGQRYFLFLEVDDRAADAVVSNVVQLLKEKRLYDQSTIVFTAAHGDSAASAWLDDRSLAIPLIVKQPDAEGAGRSVATPVQQIDIVPTLLDLVRAPIPGGLRGRSLRPILDDDEGTVTPQPIYSESLEAAWRFGGTPVYALTEEGYRLLRSATNTLLRIDDMAPEEAAGQSRLERLSAALDRLLAGHTMPVPSDIAPADETAFAAAGYLPGLRVIQPPVTPIEQVDQDRLAQSHRAIVKLVASHNYPAAVTALTNLAHTRPELAPLPFQIGLLLAKGGRFAEALAAFMTAATLRPGDADIATAMARTRLRARQIELAKAAAIEAVALADRSAEPLLMADAHDVAARVALAEPDAADAAMHAAAAEKADPARPLSAFVRGRLAYEDAKYDEALAAFQEAVKTTRERARELSELHVSLGDTLARLDRYPEAEMEFREELRAFPDSIRAYSSLVTLYRAQNRDDAARETIDALIEAAPTSEGYAAATRLSTLIGDRAKADALRAEARRRFR